MAALVSGHGVDVCAWSWRAGATRLLGTEVAKPGV